MQKLIKSQVEVTPDKHIGVRLSLQIVNGEKVDFQHYHRFPILPPGSDLANWRAAVETHIANADGGIPFAPWPAIPDSEWAEVEAVASLAWTPERVEAQRQKESEALVAAQAMAG